MSGQETLAKIDAAIEALQDGKRVASVACGDRAVKYERVELAELIRLRDRMRAEFNARNPRQKRRIVINTDKGVA